MSNQSTTLNEVVGIVDAGLFHTKASQALRMAAGSVLDTGKEGSVTIKLSLKRISDSGNVTVTHKLVLEKPTRNGKAVEETTTATPMSCDSQGNLSLFPTDPDGAWVPSGNKETANG